MTCSITIRPGIVSAVEIGMDPSSPNETATVTADAGSLERCLESEQRSGVADIRFSAVEFDRHALPKPVPDGNKPRSGREKQSPPSFPTAPLAGGWHLNDQLDETKSLSDVFMARPNV